MKTLIVVSRCAYCEVVATGVLSLFEMSVVPRGGICLFGRWFWTLFVR